MNHRKMIAAGSTASALALLLLAGLARHAYSTEYAPVTARVLVLAVATTLLGAAGLKLLCDAAALRRIERRTSGHVEGVRETVDRLAAALPRDSSS